MLSRVGVELAKPGENFLRSVLIYVRRMYEHVGDLRTGHLCVVISSDAGMMDPDVNIGVCCLVSLWYGHLWCTF